MSTARVIDRMRKPQLPAASTNAHEAAQAAGVHLGNRGALAGAPAKISGVR